MHRRLAPLAALALLLLTAAWSACTDDGPAANVRALREPAWPELSEAPATMLFERATAGDENVAHRISGTVQGASEGAMLSVDFGDGSPTQRVAVHAGGAFASDHVYASNGSFRVAARTIEGRPAYAETEVVVRPRHVVFVQGMNSESRCPDGARFADRAPSWVREQVQASHAERPNVYRYFSYSGRYCGGGDGSNGAAAEYSGGDTCEGIAAVYAPRLRALIEAVDGRVTVFAHSMGGLLAAYLVASDPAWAKDHIASVVTFDSPLGGLDGVRKSVLGGYSLFDGGCGRGAAAMDDLDGGSAVVSTAKGAGSVVAFYTLDGGSGESEVFGLAEAVPGDRTHIAAEVAHAEVDEEHSEVWSKRPGGSSSEKTRLVACALANAAAGCAARPN